MRGFRPLLQGYGVRSLALTTVGVNEQQTLHFSLISFHRLLHQEAGRSCGCCHPGGYLPGINLSAQNIHLMHQARSPMPVLPPKGQLPMSEFPCGPGVTEKPLPSLLEHFQHFTIREALMVCVCSFVPPMPRGSWGELAAVSHSVHCSHPALAWLSSPLGPGGTHPPPPGSSRTCLP